MAGRIDLKGGWYLVRCEDKSSKRFGEWFLSNPEDIWVAYFWDGREAGEEDAASFAKAQTN